MKLTEEQIMIIKDIRTPIRIDIEGVSYWVKKKKKLSAFNELVGKKIADIMGLKCPLYSFIEIDGSYYIFSKDLNMEGTFVTGIDLDVEDNSFYSIWKLFDEKKYNSSELMIDVVKIYIFDILFCYSDRYLENWGMLFKEGKQEVVIYDNEDFFNKDSRSFLTSDYEESEIEVSKENELKNFLAVSSQEFINLFYEYFQFFTPLYVRSILEEAKEESKLDIDLDELIQIYQKERNKIESILNDKITFDVKKQL